jgi:hypothetical protein
VTSWVDSSSVRVLQNLLPLPEKIDCSQLQVQHLETCETQRVKVPSSTVVKVINVFVLQLLRD